MANLQIKGMDDALYAQIKALAAAENRSISQQVLYLIKQWLSRQKQIESAKSSAQILLELSGSWDDSRRAKEIVSQIKESRIDSNKLN